MRNKTDEEKDKMVAKVKNTKENKYGDPNYNNMDKNKETKLKNHGDENYNNRDKFKNTLEEKYGGHHLKLDKFMNKQRKTFQKNFGVDSVFNIPEVVKKKKESNEGIRISKVQRKVYEQIKESYYDALLEHYIPGLNTHVDIFIPSENKIIEVYGDWWHCNPKIYKEEYYHSKVHKTAKQIWKKDKIRENLIKNNGYNLEIIWECDV